MIFRNIGRILKKDTKTKIWWIKLGAAIIFSNFLFFMAFSGKQSAPPQTHAREGEVEFQLKGDLLTPFQEGKKIVILDRKQGLLIEAEMDKNINEEGKLTVWVKADRASALLGAGPWEILPHLKELKFRTKVRGRAHEIIY